LSESPSESTLSQGESSSRRLERIYRRRSYFSDPVGRASSGHWVRTSLGRSRPEPGRRKDYSDASHAHRKSISINPRVQHISSCTRETHEPSASRARLSPDTCLPPRIRPRPNQVSIGIYVAGGFKGDLISGEIDIESPPPVWVYRKMCVQGIFPRGKEKRFKQVRLHSGHVYNCLNNLILFLLQTLLGVTKFRTNIFHSNRS